MTYKLAYFAVASVMALTGISCGGGSSGAPAPNYTTLSQLNAVWSLSGTVAFNCNGVAENQNVTATVPIYGGAFSGNANLQGGACGITGINFRGSIGLDGTISGNVVTIGGSPALSDTFAGTCTASSCTGQTSHFQLLAPFTLSNTQVNPFDGTDWNVVVTCSNGSQMSLFVTTVASVANGGTLQGAGSTCTNTTLCTASGSTTGTVAYTLSGAVTAQGALTATLTQGADGTLSFTGPTSASFTSLGGTGSFGSAVALTQCSPFPPGVLPLPSCRSCANSR
jgi:hypothetical protein